MKKIAFGILIGILLITMVVRTQEVLATPDEALTLRFKAGGRYNIVADGVGLLDITEGDISLNVPGAVIKAYLYWAGYNTIDGGDDIVSFSVDGGSAIVLTADYTFGPDLYNGVYYYYVYVEDVTSLVLTGSHTYTISNVEIWTNNGAGLMVVYEDPSLPYSIVQINYGLDYFYFGNPPPRGPNSEVVCIEFEASSLYQYMDIIFICCGVEHENRPNAIWYQTGTGVLPTNLVHESGAIELDGPPSPYPLGSKDGQQWDTYTNYITVSEGDTWACFQIESVDDVPEEQGTSCVWIATGFVLKTAPPVGGIITVEWFIPWITLIPLIAMVVVALVFRARSREK